MSGKSFSLTVSRREGYQFTVDFDNASWSSVLLDEPEPIGDGVAPNAARMLGAAVGNCLAASLLFCLEKAHVSVSDLTARVEGRIERNERGRLRVGHLKVVLDPTFEEAPPARLSRCLDIFEDFCVVTGSVRNGIDVEVEVEGVDVPEGSEESASADA